MPNLTTIEYDQPIKNLIAGLNATGHITHGNYRKDMVTIHHNGGIFTAQEVLDIWKTRAASAHFDVDKNGDLAQYANVFDYAWACASREGNERSVSIEMSNATTAPDWLVGVDTWRKSARLTGFLFASGLVLGKPTSSTVVYHHHWFPTACAGPYMDKVYDEFLDAVQAAYSMFKSGKTPTPPKHDPAPPVKHKPGRLAEDGKFGIDSIKAWQHLAGTVEDGLISSQPKSTKPYQPALLNVQYVAHPVGSRVIRWEQKRTGAKVDGLYGPNSIKATQRHVGVKADGYFGPHTARAVQHALNEGKF